MQDTIERVRIVKSATSRAIRLLENTGLESESMRARMMFTSWCSYLDALMQSQENRLGDYRSKLHLVQDLSKIAIIQILKTEVKTLKN